MEKRQDRNSKGRVGASQREELRAEMLAEDLGDVQGERDVLEEEGTELTRKLEVESSRNKALQGK